MRALAYSAGAIALKAAEALQRVFDVYVTPEARGKAAVIANVEVNQAVAVASDLALEATTALFDSLGASATSRDLGLDRYWRNARAITSHNPRIYRERSVGDWSVNGAKPPTEFRAGVPDKSPQRKPV